MSDEGLLTTAEVSEILRKPVGTLRQWRHRSYGPKGFRLGGTVVYRRSAVDAWVRECEAAESSAGVRTG
jgi:predicted DNA-binding transcriptional regulator AlpA